MHKGVGAAKALFFYHHLDMIQYRCTSFLTKGVFFSFNNVVSVGFSSPRKRSQLGHYWPYKLQPRRGSLCCVLVDFGKRLGRQPYENGRLSNVFLLE